MGIENLVLLPYQKKDIKALNKTVIVKFKNGKAFNDEIDFGDGAKLYIDGASRVEHNANSVGEVIVSGIDGIGIGDKIGLSYQALTDYTWVGDRRVWANGFEWEGDMVFVIKERHILCTIKDGEYFGFGNWVLMKDIDHKVEGDIITLGVETRLSDGKVKGEGVFICGDLPIEKGTICLFEEKFRSEYSFGWKEDYIVLGKELIYGYKNK